MSSYIIKRYAPLLTKYDVQTLFNWLIDAYGSVAKAAEITGIQRKTVYDWDKVTDEVKLETKLKILEHSVKLDENRTLQFLIEKADNDSKEVLGYYIRYMFEKAMKANSKEEFSKHFSLLRDIQRTHRGLVFDHQMDTIEERNQLLNARTKEFCIDVTETSVYTIPPEILERKVIAFLEILEKRTMTREEMKESLDLPSEFIDNICDALKYLNPGNAPSGSYNAPVEEVALGLQPMEISQLIQKSHYSLERDMLSVKSLNAKRSEV